MHETPTLENIEMRCTAAGLTLAALCKLADLNHSSLSRWRRGVVEPNRRTERETLRALDRELTIVERRRFLALARTLLGDAEEARLRALLPPLAAAVPPAPDAAVQAAGA